MPATKRRPSPTWRQFEKAVAAGVRQRALDHPITVRTRPIEHRRLSMPILSTEQVVRGPRW